MKTKQIDESYIEGAVSYFKGEDWIQPIRIPAEIHDLYYPLNDRGWCPAGVRVRFETDSDTATLGMGDNDVHVRLDLVSDNEILQSIRLEPGEKEGKFAGLGRDKKVYEIWLEHSVPVKVSALSVPDKALLNPAPDTRPKWVTYGSSITQSSGSHSPARTWPGTASRMLDLNLTCLGYGGNCHLEPMVALMIRDLEADFITLKLGINVQGQGSLNPRTYQPAVIGLVRIIREKHKTTPMGIISPIISPDRENTPNSAGMSLEDYRFNNKEGVRRLREAGDENLEYFNAKDYFGEECLEYLPDGLHPNADGYEVLGRNLADNVISKIIDKYGIKAKGSGFGVQVSGRK